MPMHVCCLCTQVWGLTHVSTSLSPSIHLSEEILSLQPQQVTRGTRSARRNTLTEDEVP